jgi:hypothetical protein
LVRSIDWYQVLGQATGHLGLIPVDPRQPNGGLGLDALVSPEEDVRKDPRDLAALSSAVGGGLQALFLPLRIDPKGKCHFVLISKQIGKCSKTL